MTKDKKQYINSTEKGLDFLIRCAFDLDDREKTEEILKEAEQETAGPDADRVRRTWQAVLRKWNA